MYGQLTTGYPAMKTKKVPPGFTDGTLILTGVPYNILQAGMDDYFVSVSLTFVKVPAVKVIFTPSSL